MVLESTMHGFDFVTLQFPIHTLSALQGFHGMEFIACNLWPGELLGFWLRSLVRKLVVSLIFCEQGRPKLFSRGDPSHIIFISSIRFHCFLKSKKTQKEVSFCSWLVYRHKPFQTDTLLHFKLEHKPFTTDTSERPRERPWGCHYTTLGDYKFNSWWFSRLTNDISCNLWRGPTTKFCWVLLG